MKKMNLLYKGRQVVVNLEEDDNGTYIENSEYADGGPITWEEEQEIFQLYMQQMDQFMHEQKIKENGPTRRH